MIQSYEPQISALMDSKLAHLTREKMEREVYKQKQDLLRLVGLCNTLDMYAKRNLPLDMSLVTKVQSSNDNNIHNVHEKSNSCVQSRNCVTEESDSASDDDYEDTNSDNDIDIDNDDNDNDNDDNDYDHTKFTDLHLISSELAPTSHLKKSALFQLQRLDRPPRRKLGDNKPLALPTQNNLHDMCVHDVGYRVHDEPCRDDYLQPISRLLPILKRYPQVRQIPREMYKIADLTF
jgi:hypothetical protein